MARLDDTRARGFRTDRARRARRLATAALALLGAGGPAACRADGAAAVKPHVVFETGLLAGGESRVDSQEGGHFRVYGETGVEWFGRRPDGARTGGIGLAAFAALGADDARVGFGPRATLPLGPRWTWQASAGPAWDEEDGRALFDQGWQARTSLLYRDTVSLTALWQTFPYHTYGSPPADGNLHALYAGAMVHGDTGRKVSLFLWGALAGIMIALILQDPPT